jgi:hypothetical protein
MPLYSFRIVHGQRSYPDLTNCLASKLAAQREALTICADLARDIVRQLEPGIEWRMDVVDGSGNGFFRLKLISEAFDSEPTAT